MITELCIDVINSFKQLRQSLAIVTDHVCTLDRALPAWFTPPSKMAVTNDNHRDQACTLLNQLEYFDNQQPREILVGAGIITGSEATIRSIQDLNTAKNAFKQAMLKLKAAKVTASNEILAKQFEELLPQRGTGVAQSLKRMGLSRLHLKQCYRRIPIILERPKKISWTWANTRSIKKISVQQAEQLLNKYNQDAGIERQIKMLHSIDPQEKLAIVQELAPHLRANVLMQNGDRIMLKGPVPIFYLDPEYLGLPEFTPPGEKKGKDKDRVIRKDVKIIPQAFLPAIRAHRYAPEYSK